MRILVIDEEFPIELNSGKRIRSANLYRRLARRHEVHYLAYDGHPSQAVPSLHDCGINAIPVQDSRPRKTGARFVANVARATIARKPWMTWGHYTRQYMAAFNEAVANIEPDLVIAEWSPYAQYLVKSAKSIRGVASAHNVEAQILERLSAATDNPLKRWVFQDQCRLVRQFERDVMSRLSGITCVSREDAEWFERYRASGKIEVVENGVDCDYYEFCSDEPASQCIAFCGSMDWRANQDAVRYFSTEVLPIIRAVVPNVRFLVIGRLPPQDLVMELTSQHGVEFTGTVPDVRPWLLQASTVVVPLRVGGGSRLKILEAFAAGRPVVSTSIGAEGLRLQDGRDLLIADTSPAIADALISLLRSHSVGHVLATNARALVERSYGWDAITARLENFLYQVIESGCNVARF